MKAGCLVACLLSLFLLLQTISIAAPDAGSPPFQFPQLPGWTLSGDVQTFSPRTLFEYIDGAADLYLTYEFRELNVAEYVNQKKGSLTVEVYKHNTPVNAFGIYSQERLSTSNFLNIGTQGYSENDVLNFLAGSYYVKVTGYKFGPEDRAGLPALGRKLAESLGEAGTLPGMISLFPEQGKIKNSEKFVAVKFLGHGFLHSGYTTEYEIGPQKFQLFIIEGVDRGDCEKMLQEYLKLSGASGKEIKEGTYTIKDPYQGEIGVGWTGKYLWGIVNSNDPSLRVTYLKLLEGAIGKK